MRRTLCIITHHQTFLVRLEDFLRCYWVQCDMWSDTPAKPKLGLLKLEHDVIILGSTLALLDDLHEGICHLLARSAILVWSSSSKDSASTTAFAAFSICSPSWSSNLSKSSTSFVAPAYNFPPTSLREQQSSPSPLMNNKSDRYKNEAVNSETTKLTNEEV